MLIVVTVGTISITFTSMGGGGNIYAIIRIFRSEVGESTCGQNNITYQWLLKLILSRARWILYGRVSTVIYLPHGVTPHRTTSATRLVLSTLTLGNTVGYGSPSLD